MTTKISGSLDVLLDKYQCACRDEAASIGKKLTADQHEIWRRWLERPSVVELALVGAAGQVFDSYRFSYFSVAAQKSYLHD